MPPFLVDTHAHLDDPGFDGDRAEVLVRAQAAGVTHILTVATTALSSAANLDLAEAYPLLRASVGIQPNHAAEAAAGDWDRIMELAARPGTAALGETGLDRHWDYTPFPLQEDYFARHLALARRLGLPVIIHCREAEEDVLRMLREDFDRHGPVRGVMHSFTGDLAAAQACLAMGLFLSFAGMVTYKNAQDLRAVAAQTPADRILVETDSPYLTPVPLRGKVKRNEPAHLAHTARLLAETRGEPFADFARLTAANAVSLFRLS